MSDTTTRKTFKYKTFKYKLNPTSAQERALDEVLWHCRVLYNTALEQRISLYRQRGVSHSRYAQEAELKALRAQMPEYGAIHSHVLQDVLARLDKTYQAFFRRVQAGEKAGFPRFQGRNRFHSFTYKEYGNGATLDNGGLVLSKIGRLAVRWSRPLEGVPKTVTISREADGWYVAFSCADVPVHSLPLTGQETGIDLGLESFATLADGSQMANPRIFRVAEMALKRAASGAATGGAKRCYCWRSHINGSGGRGRTFTRRRRSNWSASTMSSITKRCRRPTCSGTTISPRVSAMRAGRRS